MIEILRDPVWQFIGAILAMFGVVGAFWIYWLQRQTKELAFGLVSSRRPLAIADELSSRVTVQLDGKPVGNLHLLIYGLKNSGRRAIAQADFDKPLSITYTDGRVVSAEIASQTPPNLGGQLVISESRVELVPLLLNPGDQLLIQVLLSSAKPTSSLNARVFDVSSFAPVNVTPRLPPFFQSGLPLLMVVLLILGTAMFFFSERSEQAYAFLAFAAFVPAFGLVSRLLRDSGAASRRRIDEI
ncbi:hypothetical protein [Polaromonas sp.]|uniref:hypothetical protein n=1 Tax=Polaromonas sp. TaxID=1869339 RepID=UPI003BACD440